MPGWRAVVGSVELKRVVDGRDSNMYPLTGSIDQQNKQFSEAVMDVTAELNDAATRYKNGNIDAWGFVAQLEMSKAAIEGFMRGVRG